MATKLDPPSRRQRLRKRKTWKINYHN